MDPAESDKGSGVPGAPEERGPRSPRGAGSQEPKRSGVPGEWGPRSPRGAGSQEEPQRSEVPGASLLLTGGSAAATLESHR
ncbi:unnamed protein product [Boreogadus saida]